jgi:carbon storage regulator CsrA
MRLVSGGGGGQRRIGTRPALRMDHLVPLITSPFGTKECAMLVLSRKLQEKIRIGENVTITVLQVKGRHVKLGIDAPRNVRVIRTELPQEITVETSDNTETSEPETERDTPATDVLKTGETQDITPSTKPAGKPVVIGRRFRIVTPSQGAHRHAVAAVAIG